jgi:hypothetical protein
MVGVTQLQAWKIMRHYGVYLHNLHKVHRLLPGKRANGVRFCERVQPLLYILPDIRFLNDFQFSWDSFMKTGNSAINLLKPSGCLYTIRFKI